MLDESIEKESDKAKIEELKKFKEQTTGFSERRIKNGYYNINI